MARFLFVVPPLTGHVNPTVSIGRELARRGHDVAWSGPPRTDRLLPKDVQLFTVGDPSIAASADRRLEEFRGLRHVAALRFLWQEVLIPLAHAMAGDVDAVVDRWQPDVMVADQQALAGAAVARKRSLPWATSASTPAELASSLSAFPLVDQWVRDQLAELQAAVGVPAALISDQHDLRFSEHLVLVFSTPELVSEQTRYPPHYRFVGPAFTDRHEPHDFPWGWLDPNLPHVLVSLGTFRLRGSERFFAAAAEALAGESLQAILVAPPELLSGHTSADNLLVQERVPQVRLLPRLDAVVCHGGPNTVYEALAHGVPVVVAPVVNDGPIIADQVERIGAGVRVRYARLPPSQLRIAVRSVLDQSTFRRAALAVQRSFGAAGGASRAADDLEELAGRGRIGRNERHVMSDQDPRRRPAGESDPRHHTPQPAKDVG